MLQSGFRSSQCLAGKGTGDDVLAPDRAEGPAGKPRHHEILDHLLAQVVVGAVDLILAEEGRDMGGKLVGSAFGSS